MQEQRLAMYDAGTPSASELAVVRPQHAGTVAAGSLRIPSPDEMAALAGYASAMAGGKMYPHIKSEEQAMTVCLMAWDYQVSPTVMAQNVHIIEGKMSLAATFTAGLVSRVPGYLLRIVESTDQVATVEGKRPEWPESQRYSYTIRDAETAQLLGKTNWKKDPKSMLRSRVMSHACRMWFPDIASGLYDPTELQDFAEPTPPAIPARRQDAITHPAPKPIASGNGNGGSAAMRRLHAVGREHGLDHDAIKRFAASMGHTGSLADLDDATLDTITHRIEQVAAQADAMAEKAEWGEIVDADTGEIFDDESETSETDNRILSSFVDQINGADTKAALKRVGEAIKRAGLPGDMADELRGVYQRRESELNGGNGN